MTFCPARECGRFRHLTAHYLVECEAIEILRALFGEVLIPPTVHRELQHEKTPRRVRAWAQALPVWLKVQAPTVVDSSSNVDEGEREAISLAREVKAVAILMDDRKGRAEAARCGLRVAGTIRVLEAAAQRGLVDFAVAIQRLRQTNARLDEEVLKPHASECNRNHSELRPRRFPAKEFPPSEIRNPSRPRRRRSRPRQATLAKQNESHAHASH